MRKTSLASRIICAATATALFAMPLLACGDDDELQGGWISERQWENGIDALLACENYTETTTGHQVNEQDGQVYDAPIDNITYKFDIDNNVIFVSSSIYHPPFSLSPFTAYEFGCTVNNPETDELETWCICVYCNKATKNEWEARDEGIVEPSEFKSNFLLTKGKNSIISEIINNESIDIKRRYKDSKFNSDDGSFTYDYNYYEFIQADNITYVASSSSFKLYFTDNRFCGLNFNAKTETATQLKNNNKIYHSTTTQDMTTVCSNFGTTVIDVPDEVKTVLQYYKATHNPYTEEE